MFVSLPLTFPTEDAMVAASCLLSIPTPFTIIIQSSRNLRASLLLQTRTRIRYNRVSSRSPGYSLLPFSRFPISASSSSSSSSIQGSRQTIQTHSPLPPLAAQSQIYTIKFPFPFPQVSRNFDVNKGMMLVITAAILGVALVVNFMRSKDRTSGSVEDLVKRGQLRYDRKSDSRPLRYEDPFNNPMVKVGEKDVKMYGKSFRLQPVTLTQEKMRTHQHRRVQAYQWKRPTVFLVEGESVPEGVDPDTVRWIPPNHPFATAKNDFDEVAAEKNVYQTRGVPSRLKAEHEALRKRMMENSEKVNFPTVPSKERANDEKRPQSSAEQIDNGFPSRPIRPFERSDVSISRKMQQNTD